MGLLQLSTECQDRRGHAKGQRLLVLPRTARRCRAHLRAVLSHAETCGEEIWRIQRNPRKGGRREVSRMRRLKRRLGWRTANDMLNRVPARPSRSLRWSWSCPDNRLGVAV